jgi:AraC-like DNA-binding protein
MAHGLNYRIGSMVRLASARLGLSTARILARAGLADDHLAHEARGVDARGWFAVVNAIAAEAGDPDVALTLGREAAKGVLQPAMLAFAASPTVGEGLRRIQLFKPLIAPIRLAIFEDAEGFAVEFRPADPACPIGPVTATMEIAYFVELVRILTAHPVTPLLITLPQDARATPAFRAFVGSPIATGPTTRIFLSRDDAGRQIISADTGLRRIIEAELFARLKAVEDPMALAVRVRREIGANLASGRVSIDLISRRLGTSRRSLQRRLAEEGTSFQALLDETRTELALAYLQDQNLSAEETSYLLGFGDPNSFYRAFQGWTGMTPATARAAGSARLA